MTNAMPTFWGPAALAGEAAGQASRAALSAPFDVLRAQYAISVRSGLIERSLLAWSGFERSVGALERLMYGPFARCV